MYIPSLLKGPIHIGLIEFVKNAVQIANAFIDFLKTALLKYN